MQNLVFKSSIYLLIGVSAVIWFILAFLKGLDLSDAGDFFSQIPQVASIDLIIVAVFAKWGWTLRMFRGWLVPFPNLTGTWTGHIYSEWVNPDTGERPGPIPVMLTINQSFSHISCVMHTEEMISYSFLEGFLIDTDRQVKRLAYSYTAKPRVSLSERNVPNDGTGVFDIIEKPNLQLKGRYWTEQLTRGEILLTRYSRDILEEMPNTLDRHPVTEAENRR